jgi:PAS domain S-box-containing protein
MRRRVREMNGDAGNDLFDLVQESIILRDEAGRITGWNAGSERLYGWNRREALGQKADVFLRTSGELISRVEDALRETGRWEGDLARVTSAGETVVVQMKWHLRDDARDDPACIIETGVDVTAQRRETIEQRYRSLFHFVPVALIQLDRTELANVFETLKAQGVQDFARYIEEHPNFTEFALNSIRIHEVNRRTVELFGAEHAGQMLGPVARLWTENPEIFQQSMMARFRGAARYEAEIRIRTFDGRLLDVLYVTDFPEALKYEALGLAGLVDVSDRVKAQATLAQVQADFTHAARVSMLGELTASIAHEVNQPLGAILTTAETALRWLGRVQPDLDELRALSKRTIGDARRAADIIDRIRAMAMRHEVRQECLPLNGVVDDVLVFLGPELRRQSIATVLELESNLPDILADRVQLQQVIANIAINAVQAMDGCDERRLTIRTTLQDPGTTCVEIADTGPGIRPEQFPRLFQSFFTTKPSGMGIGLAVCRSIIEAHGGAIKAANLPGGGACFRFTLPVGQHSAECKHIEV